MSGKKENTLYRKISASMECKAEIFCPALVCVLVLASFSPLLLAGVPETGDIDFHISRINELASALQERNFPLLFNFNAFSGCGHAAGLFFPYILLLPAAVMVNLSIPVMTAYKIFAVITGLFAALSAYHAVRKISNDPFSAFAGGILYALCSYFACNYFTRSAVDEWLAMAFLPWIVLGMWQVVYAGKPTWGSLTLGLAGVIAAHPVTAFTAMIFCMAIFLCNAVSLFRRPRRIFIACATLLLAAGMNIYYIAPAFEHVLLMDFSFMFPEGAAADNCVPLTRLVLETPYNQPGNWIPAGTGMIFAVLLLRRWRFGSPGQKVDKYRDLVLLAGGGALLSATDFLPWEWQVPGLELIRYPWRTYSLASCALALGGALLLAGIFARDRRKRRFWMIAVVLGSLSGWWFTTADAYLQNGVYLDDPAGVTHSGNAAYLPAGVMPDDLSDRGEGAVIISGEGEVELKRLSAKEFALEYNKKAGFPMVVELPALYFRGWYGRLKGLPPQDAAAGDKGFATVRIPAVEESGTMIISYDGTAVQKVSAGISLCLFTFVLGTWVLNMFRIDLFRKKSKI